MIRHLHEYMFAVLLGFLSTGIWALGSDRGHMALPLGLAFAGLVSAYIYLRQMRLGMKAPGLLGLFFRPEDPTLDLPLAAMRTAAVFLLVFCGMIALLTHDLYTAWKAELASDSPQTTEPSDTSASGSPPPDATRELAAQVGALAAAIRALPASAPVSSWMQAPPLSPTPDPRLLHPPRGRQRPSWRYRSQCGCGPPRCRRPCWGCLHGWCCAHWAPARRWRCCPQWRFRLPPVA